MAYANITFDAMVAALALRLGDVSKRFWLDAELRDYITEALRTWQVFSAHESKSNTLTATLGGLFYNLFSLLTDLIPTVTDRDLIQTIQRHLQEPVSATSWTGSEQFTYNDLVQAIQRRRDQFLLETGIVLTVSEIPFVATGSDDTHLLSDSVIDIRRAMWKVTSTGTYYQMFRVDQLDRQASGDFNPAAAIPSLWLRDDITPLSITVDPPPAAAGSLNLITLNVGATLTPATSATILGIPNDLCWVIKWGALADLLGREGPGLDTERAQYCESRWREGIQLARITNFLKSGFTGNQPYYLDSLSDLDAANPEWINSSGSVYSVHASANIVAVSNRADGSYPIGLVILPKAPVPVAGGDYLQVGREVINTLLDYCVHLASFKQGGTEFLSSSVLYQNLVRAAAIQNDRLRANAKNFDALSVKSFRDSQTNTRRQSDIELEPLNYEQAG